MGAPAYGWYGGDRELHDQQLGTHLYSPCIHLCLKGYRWPEVGRDHCAGEGDAERWALQCVQPFALIDEMRGSRRSACY